MAEFPKYVRISTRISKNPDSYQVWYNAHNVVGKVVKAIGWGPMGGYQVEDEWCTDLEAIYVSHDRYTSATEAEYYAERPWLNRIPPEVKYGLNKEGGLIAYTGEAPVTVKVHLEKSNEPIPVAVLKAGLKHMEDRASTYDSPGGERSMKATVEAFNAISGHELTEEEGWMFMILLKLVRSQQGNFKSDNFEDASAYCGLMAEAATPK